MLSLSQLRSHFLNYSPPSFGTFLNGLSIYDSSPHIITRHIQLYKHIKTHEEKQAQTHKAVISNSKQPFLLMSGSPDHHDNNRRHKHHNCHHKDQGDDHNRVCPQSNAGQVHPSNRGEVGHTEPQLEREIQIVSDYW